MRPIRKFSKKLSLRQLTAYALIYCMLLPLQLTHAIPLGAGSVVDGSADINYDVPDNTTTVTMQTPQAVIDWRTLDTAPSELLQFLKDPGSFPGNFTVLNRVTEGPATNFNGDLFGPEGHIIIVNPYGIIFGEGATIETYKFTASGLAIDMTNSSLVDDYYQFDGGEGTVTNYGEIIAEQVSLIGRQVVNAGTITSPGGAVIMAAGDQVYLGHNGSSIVVEVAMDMAQVENYVVDNGGSEGEGPGEIDADDGEVILAAGDIFSTAIKGIESLSAKAERYATFKGDIVADSSVTVEAGSDIALEGVDVGSPTEDTAGIRIKSEQGDIETGYLNARSRADNSITVIAAGDLTITGDSSHGAVSAKTNNVPEADSATSDICLQAGGDMTIDYGILAEAHGKEESTAVVHLHGGEGDIVVDTHNGWIEAWAETSGGSEPGLANAAVLIHTQGSISIDRNGSTDSVRARAKVAGGGLFDLWGDGGETYQDESGDGAHATIDIDEGYEGDCPGCGDTDSDSDSDTDVYPEAAPIREVALKSTGCPALMNWVSKELGLEAEQLQIYMENAMALSDDVSPCDMCARLRSAAMALRDPSGKRTEALANVVNEFATTPAPLSEEQMAMIAAALTEAEEGTQYALAAEWVDALVAYLEILNDEMLMQPEDALTTVAKYAEPITAGDDTVLSAYVEARLTALGG